MRLRQERLVFSKAFVRKTRCSFIGDDTGNHQGTNLSDTEEDAGGAAGNGRLLKMSFRRFLFG